MLQGIVSNFPDANLIPNNIVQGVTIFGVAGNAIVGQVTGTGFADLFFGFDGSEALRMDNGARGTCGTFETANAIYFVYGVCTGANGGGGVATTTLSIARRDKTLGTVTTYRSGPIRTAVRNTGTLGLDLTEDSGIIYCQGNYGTMSVSQHIEFDTATDTFGAFGSNVFGGVNHRGSATTLASSFSGALFNMTLYGSGIPQGTAGGVVGSALGNSVAYSGFTYSTEVLAHTSSGDDAGTVISVIASYGVAKRV